MPRIIRLASTCLLYISAARRSDFFAKGTGNFKNGRLIILGDEYSASASEIVTGAIQDWDRGVVVAVSYTHLGFQM